MIRKDVRLNEMAFPVRMAKYGKKRMSLTITPNIKFCKSNRCFFDFPKSETPGNNIFLLILII